MPKDVVVKVHGTVTDAIVDLGSGVVVKDNYGKAKTITMKKESDTVFSSIIVPQRIDNRQPLIEVLTNNVSYLMESRFVFRSGIQHSVNIILDSDPAKVKIEIGGEIQGWNYPPSGAEMPLSHPNKPKTMYPGARCLHLPRVLFVCGIASRPWFAKR